jgi:pyridoxamine 5'-phosphate oxidase
VPERPPLDPSLLVTMRNDYSDRGIDQAALAAGWPEQLGRWLADADAAGLPEPNAMVLATAGADGRPSSRTVLLKGYDAGGLVFFTNYDSRKGGELTANPFGSATFPWYGLHRQVHAVGAVARLDAAGSDAYFASRPRGAQLGAWSSPQSTVIPDRSVLDEAFAAAEARWPEPAEVPRPPHWGGFRLRPDTVEFWQGRANRVHDRLRYRRAGGGWTLERLAP